jgi:TatD DNase family protein
MLKLPLILHIRSADAETIKRTNKLNDSSMVEHVDAHKEAIKILKEFDENLMDGVKGVIHCFTSKKLSDAEEYIKMGYMLGIGGAFTYPENEELKAILRQVPLEYIVLETDSPFVLPVGMPENEACPEKRNTPLSILYIAEELAKLKGLSVDEVAAVTTENAKRLFRIE